MIVPCIVNAWLNVAWSRNCMPGHRQLGADDQRQDPGGEEEQEAVDDVQDPDLLVVDGRQPLDDPRASVLAAGWLERGGCHRSSRAPLVLYRLTMRSPIIARMDGAVEGVVAGLHGRDDVGECLPGLDVLAVEVDLLDADVVDDRVVVRELDAEVLAGWRLRSGRCRTGVTPRQRSGWSSAQSPSPGATEGARRTRSAST